MIFCTAETPQIINDESHAAIFTIPTIKQSKRSRYIDIKESIVEDIDMSIPSTSARPKFFFNIGHIHLAQPLQTECRNELRKPYFNFFQYLGVP